MSEISRAMARGDGPADGMPRRRAAMSDPIRSEMGGHRLASAFSRARSRESDATQCGQTVESAHRTRQLVVDHTVDESRARLWLSRLATCSNS